MKTKKQPIRKKVAETLPLRDLVEEIKLKGNLTQHQIEHAIGHAKNYISRQMWLEETGQRPSAILFRDLQRKYEFLLTGKKTLEIESQQALNERLVDQIILLKAQMDVVYTELATLLDAKNVSMKKNQLTTTAKEVADKMKSEL